MDINLEKFSVETHKSGSIEIRLQTKEMRENPTGYWREYPTSIMIHKPDLRYFLNCLKGTSKGFFPIFDDLSYQTQPYPDGMRVMYVGGHFTERYTVNFPFKFFPALHYLLEKQIKHPAERKFELSPELLEEYSARYQSRAVWNYKDIVDVSFANHEFKETLLFSLGQSIEKWGKEYPDLKEKLENLYQNGLRYSVYGEEISLDLSFDQRPIENVPDSYFLFVHPTGKNDHILVAGIIAHKNSKTGEYHYSIHT